MPHAACGALIARRRCGQGVVVEGAAQAVASIIKMAAWQTIGTRTTASGIFKQVGSYRPP
jgi:hypothetical protein